MPRASKNTIVVGPYEPPVEDSVADFLKDIETKVVGNALKKRLKDIYTAGQEPDYREDVHFSDFTGKSFCHRKMILSAFFKPQEMTHPHPRIAYFERGKDMHTRWQQKFLKAGVVVMTNGVQGVEAVHELEWWQHNDQGLPTQLNWKTLFTPDLIVDMQDGTGPEIVELKGYKNAMYVKLVQHPEILPQDAYVQANMYMHVTGIHKCMIIVENKDSNDFSVWRGEYDPLLAQPFDEKLQEIDQLVSVYLQTGKLPSRICIAPDVPLAKECRQCNNCFMTRIEREKFRK